MSRLHISPPRRWLVLLLIVLACEAWVQAVPAPHVADGNTLVLFHFDESQGGSVTANLGSLGGKAYSVNETSATTAPAKVADVFGFSSYSGFGNASWCGPGEVIGWDSNSNGVYDGDSSSTSLSADRFPMSLLNMGNGGQTPWTLEALIQPTATNVNQEIISTDSSASSRGFQFRIEKEARLELNLIATGPDILTPIPSAGPHAYAPNTWYHVAATYDGANIVLYWTKVGPSTTVANAISTNAAAVGTSFGSVQGPLTIGNENRGSAGENFSYLIDEVRLSNIARAADQMLFPAGNSGPVTVSPTVTAPANPVYAGTPVTLNATVNGAQPFNYVWQTDSGTGALAWTNLPGSTTNFYTLNTTAMPAGNYQYRLIVSNAVSSATNTPATLNLLAASGPVLLADTTILPSDVLAGGPVSLSASFSGTQPLSYQWYVTNNSGVTLLAGATNPTYTISRAQTNNSGHYFLLASNHPPGLGSQTSSSTPTRLTVSSAFQSGSGMFCNLLEHPEETVISDSAPAFGWVYQPSFRNDAQSAYRLIVASSQTLANAGVGDLWDSGWVNSPNSINLPYGGAALQPGTNYFWRVQTMNSLGQTNTVSQVQQFNTASQLFDPLTTSGVVYQLPGAGSANCYPLRYVPVAPVLVTNTGTGVWFVDFGNDAFGYATVHLNGNYSGSTVNFGLGEAASGYNVNTSPGATIRYQSGSYSLQNGDVIYTNRSSFTGSWAISPPTATYGKVSPFRYLQLTGVPAGAMLTTNDVTQWRLQTEFDRTAATFSSSSTNLNQVWRLCHYSMEALTFDGIYIDGDRERKPYEADAYIQQMSAYAAENQFTLPRCTFEYLTTHLTWPTEWPMHMVFIAWADYQQTGDPYLLSKYYGFLTNQFRMSSARSDGLISGLTMGNSPGDIVDWPASDRDGYVWESYSAELNAFYYRCLTIMTQVAQATGHAADAANFRSMASQVFSSYDSAFWNATSQCYSDGEGTTHTSMHGNFFPLVFGLVPTNKQPAVVRYLNNRVSTNGMVPSVYGAQYLLEGMFQAGDTDVALRLMATNSSRSWMNMLNIGATLTTEAWSTADKANEDWNHAWGAAPGNLIPRYVLGVRPLAAGYGQILVQPHLGTTLSFAQGTVPTIRGPVSVLASNVPGQFQMLLTIPGNVTATVLLPATNPTAIVDGVVAVGTLSTDSLSNSWLTVTNLGSGQHAIWASSTSSPDTNILLSNWTSSWFGTNANNPAIAGQNLDPDGDGVSNYNEFIAGTNPLNATDSLKIAVSSLSSSPLVAVTLNGHTGRHYSLQHTPALNPASWTVVDTQAANADNQSIVLHEPLLPGAQQMFLRVVVSYP